MAVKALARLRRACILLSVFSLLAGLIVAFLAVKPLLESYASYGSINPCKGAPVLELYDPVLVVGDVYFRGFWEERFAGLKSLVLEHGVEVVVFNGDLYESPGVFWGLSSELGAEEALKYTLRELGIHDLGLTIIYLEGSPAHDPEFFSILELLGGRDSSYVIHGSNHTIILYDKPCIAIHVGGVKALIMHGDKAFNAQIAHAINRIVGKPLVEALWKRLIGVEGDTWLIASHSHVPGIDSDSKVANTGSWLKSTILSPETGTGIIVSVEGVKLVRAKS